MGKQTESGKAFEYALITTAHRILSTACHTNLIQNQSLDTARRCYEKFSVPEQTKYNLAAGTAIDHIRLLEPMLTSVENGNDILQLELAADIEGGKGDVRDVILSRPLRHWSIGISAKNNHVAVKHSRLSDIADFGDKWMGVPCSATYFAQILPAFLNLREHKKLGAKWRDLPRKHQDFYIPVLNAFRDEMKRITRENVTAVPGLISYLLGTNDFYKVIKGKGVTQIMGFNLNGQLSKQAPGIRPVFKVDRLKLPSTVIQFEFKPESTDTLLMVCDGGWTISFRIHNAETHVVPSLKFDVKLEGQPPALYNHRTLWP